MLISEILSRTTSRELPSVPLDHDIETVVETIARCPHSRLVYVVDDDRRVQGVITIGAIIRQLYPHHYSERLRSRDILRQINARSAANLMTDGDIFASPDDEVENVLALMAKKNVKEMAVVDDERRLIADITAVDLLRHYELSSD